MEDEDKMMLMYQAIQGGSLTDRDMDRLSVEPVDAEWDSPLVLRYYKDGNVCWEYTKEELLFQYITKSWVKCTEPTSEGIKVDFR
jgi:hypothetical protein